MSQALVERLDGYLHKVRVIQPDLLAIGDQYLLQRRIGVPAKLARALQGHLTAGFLQVGAVGAERHLREITGQRVGRRQQLIQALGGRRFVLSHGRRCQQCSA